MDLPDAGREPGAEEALRDGRGDLRAFFEAVDDLIFVATPGGRLVYANPALSARLGYSAEHIAAMHLLDLHPLEMRDEAEAIHAALLRGDRDDCPLPLQAASGALVPVETRVWLGRWNGADCAFGISRDLTAEQEALQRFERLFRGNPVPMALNRGRSRPVPPSSASPTPATSASPRCARSWRIGRDEQGEPWLACPRRSGPAPAGRPPCRG